MGMLASPISDDVQKSHMKSPYDSFSRVVALLFRPDFLTQPLCCTALHHASCSSSFQRHRRGGAVLTYKSWTLLCLLDSIAVFLVELTFSFCLHFSKHGYFAYKPVSSSPAHPRTCRIEGRTWMHTDSEYPPTKAKYYPAIANYSTLDRGSCQTVETRAIQERRKRRPEAVQSI